MSFVLEVLKQVFKSILAALLTEAFIKDFIIFGLEKLVKKTDNELDDEIVAKVKAAMYPPKDPQ